MIQYSGNHRRIYKRLCILMSLFAFATSFTASLFFPTSTNKFLTHFRSFGLHPLNFEAIFSIFPFPQTSIRKLLVCDQWLNTAVNCLVQCPFQVLHECIWCRWYTFKQSAFSCKEIFSTLVNRWYCTGAIV